MTLKVQTISQLVIILHNVISMTGIRMLIMQQEILRYLIHFNT